MFDFDTINIINKENRAEEREIRRHALDLARKISDPIRRQKTYNETRWPELAIEGLTEEQLNMPY